MCLTYGPTYALAANWRRWFHGCHVFLSAAGRPSEPSKCVSSWEPLMTIPGMQQRHAPVVVAIELARSCVVVLVPGGGCYRAGSQLCGCVNSRWWLLEGWLAVVWLCQFPVVLLEGWLAVVWLCQFPVVVALPKVRAGIYWPHPTLPSG